ncbi:MAG: MFS transporter [Streptococcaceae bacterium]|jgi:predicted MFS family arabinose efflux permease|nr:MFS transporter [Streptococcaceae bacterium]
MKMKQIFIVLSLFIGVFVVGADSFIISPLLPTIAQNFHASIAQTALGVTAYALCEMLGAPLFGPFGDRFSKRKLLLTGIGIFLIGTLLCALATNLATFYLYRAIAGLGAALFLPNVWAFIGSYFSGKTHAETNRMNKIMGIVMAALSLSVALGVPLGSFLAQLSNWHMAFWASAILTACAALVILLVLPDTPTTAQKISYLQNFKQVFSTKGALRALVISLFYMFAFYLVYTFLGSFLTVTFHLSLGQRGLVFFLYGVANFIGAIFGGAVMNRLGRVRSILMNAALSALFVLGLGLLGSQLPILLIFLILLALSMGLGVTAISAYIVSIAPQNRSTLMSFNSSVLYLGLTIGSSLGGLLFQNIGFWSLATVSAVAFLTAAVMVMTMQRSAK